MIYFGDLSKEKLYRLADDLVEAIEKACWLDDRRVPKPKLGCPTPHMRSAIDNFKTYVNDPCLTCGRNRRGI